MKIDEEARGKLDVPYGEVVSKALGMTVVGWGLDLLVGAPIAWINMIAWGNVHHDLWPSVPAPGYLTVLVVVLALRQLYRLSFTK